MELAISESSCTSSEPLGQISHKIKRGPGPSELKLQLQLSSATGDVGQGLSVRRTLAQPGIPRGTFYACYERYLARGAGALEDCQPAPRLAGPCPFRR